MNKLPVWYLLAFGLLAAGVSARAATLLIPERQGPPGSLIRVDIAVEGADSLAGLELLLEYDDTFLEFIRVEEEGSVHDFLTASRARENQVAISMARPEPVGAPYAVICGLTFRIRQSVQIGASTEITWRSSRLFSVSSLPIEHEVHHGVVRARDIACYPNPITPGNRDGINDVAYFVLPEEMMSTADVKIFNISGDLVRELQPQGSSTLQWDGCDSSGELGKPGVYLYLVTVENSALRKGTITIMR